MITTRKQGGDFFVVVKFSFFFLSLILNYISGPFLCKFLVVEMILLLNDSFVNGIFCFCMMKNYKFSSNINVNTFGLLQSSCKPLERCPCLPTTQGEYAKIN